MNDLGLFWAKHLLAFYWDQICKKKKNSPNSVFVSGNIIKRALYICFIFLYLYNNSKKKKKKHSKENNN